MTDLRVRQKLSRDQRRLQRAKEKFDVKEYKTADYCASRVTTHSLIGPANHMRMLCYVASGNAQDAVKFYNLAVAHGEDKNPEFLSNAAQMYRLLGNKDMALSSVIAALEMDNTNADTHFMHGNVLSDFGEYEQAIRAFNQGMELRYAPEYFTNLGNCWSNLNQYELAKKMHYKCIEELGGQKHCTNPFPFLNLASIALDERDYGFAEILYRKIVGFDPTNGQAHLGLAHCYLINAQEMNGWEEYRWRFIADNSEKKMPWPEWNGKFMNETNKKILIVHEQGYGDAFFAGRFLHKFDWRHCALLCPDDMKDFYLEMVRDISFFDPKDYYDCYVNMMDLFRIFDTPRDTVKAEWVFTPFLPSSYPTIGFCWRGRQKPDPRRTMEFREILKLIHPRCFPPNGIAPFIKICLQADFTDNEVGFFDSIDPMKNWVDTTLAISRCHAVVTIDTSIANLCGAMGKRALVMLPYASDWRWQMAGDDLVKKSAFYPSLTLVGQTDPGDWSFPIEFAKEFIEETLRLLK